jgi:hypothetical protein
MTPRSLAALGMALGITRLVAADEAPAPNPQALGSIEAILTKCAELDPAHAARYQSQAKMLAQGASEEAIGELRKTDDYRRAYEAATQSMAAVAGEDALKTCTGSLGQDH